MKSDRAGNGTPEENSAAMLLDDTGTGDIRIHEDVIASLARHAALAVPGVSRLAGNPLMNNLAEIVGSHRMQSRAIAVRLGEKNVVTIGIKVVIRFGFCSPDVAAEIQRAVIDEVEKSTRMNVAAVDVLVQEVESGRKGDAENPEEEPKP